MAGVLRTVPLHEFAGCDLDPETFELPMANDPGMDGWTYRAIRRLRCSARLGLLRRWSRGSAGLLDVGGHDGAFAAFAKQRGWEVSVVEPVSEARRRSQDRGVTAVAKLDDLVNEQFGAITLWHVLEHVEDLEALLEALRSRLTPAGRLFVTCPNHEADDAKRYGVDWAGWDVPRHRWHFSRRGLIECLKRSGWRVLTSRISWMDVFYVCLLSERRMAGTRGRFLGLRGRATAVALRSNALAMLSGEGSAVTVVAEPADRAEAQIDRVS